MRRCKVLLTLLATVRLYRAINRALGYPRLGRAPDGRIVRPSAENPRWGVTMRHCIPRKHPTQSRWALHVDGAIQALHGRVVDLNGTPYTIDLSDAADTDDSTWVDLDTSADDEPVPEEP